MERQRWIVELIQRLAQLLRRYGAALWTPVRVADQPPQPFEHLWQPLQLEPTAQLDAVVTHVHALRLREVHARGVDGDAALLYERAHELTAEPLLAELDNERRVRLNRAVRRNALILAEAAPRTIARGRTPAIALGRRGIERGVDHIIVLPRRG